MNLLLNIDVPDLKGAKEFYCAAFDLSVGRLLGNDVLELIGGTISIYLLQKPEGSAPTEAASARTYKRHWTPVHLDIVVPDLEAAIVRMLAAGATHEGAVIEASWGKLALFADPFGHGFCLIEFVGRGYDEIAVG